MSSLDVLVWINIGNFSICQLHVLQYSYSNQDQVFSFSEEGLLFYYILPCQSKVKSLGGLVMIKTVLHIPLGCFRYTLMWSWYIHIYTVYASEPIAPLVLHHWDLFCRPVFVTKAPEGQWSNSQEEAFSSFSFFFFDFFF